MYDIIVPRLLYVARNKTKYERSEYLVLPERTTR